MEWKEVKLKDICTITRGASPRPIQKFLSPTGMPWVKISDATSSNSPYIEKTSEFIINEGVSKSRVVYPGDLIVSNSATPGLPKFLAIEACVHDGWLIIRDFKNVLKEFLYYQFIYIRKKLSNQANGSVFMNLKTDIVKEYVINLPTLEDQQKIANILSSLDAKIENNNKVNANLEAQAAALFKSWFVDFEPFRDGEFVESELGMIPKGWKDGTLDSLCSFISRGMAPKYNDDTNEWILGQTCVRNNIVTLNNARKHLPKTKTEKWVKQWDILLNSTGIGSLGRVGIVYFDKDNVAFDTHITVVRVADPLYRHYVGRNLLSRQLEIENMAVGSTGQTELPKESVKTMPIIIPEGSILEQFNKLIEPIGKMMISNIDENQRLSSLRDTLLPKLMSGEMDLDNISI